jgi:glucose-1-phosphate adenylyltransferase
MHNNLIILAGGMSSRMKTPNKLNVFSDKENEQANIRNKSLIAVGLDNRPLMDYLLYNAKKAGYKNIYIVTNKNDSLFKELYGQKKTNNTFKGLNISFVTQYIPKNRVKPFGTADAVFQAIIQFPILKSQQYTVCNSDNLYSEKSLKAIRESENLNAFISYDRDALVFSIEKVCSFAIISLDDKNYLRNIIEKPSVEFIEHYRDNSEKIRVSMNLFKLDGKTTYSYLKNCPIHTTRNEKELPTVVLNCVKDSAKAFLGIPISEHVPDLTAKEDILFVKEYLKKHYPMTLNW